jgi:hypothetical protein
VGSALKWRKGLANPLSWGTGSDISQAARRLETDRTTLRNEEALLEVAVSEYVRAMPFLWLAIVDPPGSESLRGMIEQNSIALLSNYGRDPLDPPSSTRMGHNSDRERVRQSGLWNNNHVGDRHDSKFLSILEKLIENSHTWPLQRGTRV